MSPPFDSEQGREIPAVCTGCVVWPTHLDDNGEGGLVVLAVWRVARTVPETATRVASDPFVACFEAGSMTVAVGECNELSDDANGCGPAVGPRRERLFNDPRCPEVSAPVLGAIQLGSSTGTWVAPDADLFDGYWRATRDDLTPGGLALLEALDALYGRRGELITILDT